MGEEAIDALASHIVTAIVTAIFAGVASWWAARNTLKKRIDRAEWDWHHLKQELGGECESKAVGEALRQYVDGRIAQALGRKGD